MAETLHPGPGSFVEGAYDLSGVGRLEEQLNAKDAETLNIAQPGIPQTPNPKAQTPKP